jgi:hypothetical protein
MVGGDSEALYYLSNEETPIRHRPFAFFHEADCRSALPGSRNWISDPPNTAALIQVRLESPAPLYTAGNVKNGTSLPI